MDARQVTRYRNKLGKNVMEFAELIGVSWSTIYRWERGEVTPDKRTEKLIRMLAREKGAA